MLLVQEFVQRLCRFVDGIFRVWLREQVIGGVVELLGLRQVRPGLVLVSALSNTAGLLEEEIASDPSACCPWILVSERHHHPLTGGLTRRLRMQLRQPSRAGVVKYWHIALIINFYVAASVKLTLEAFIFFNMVLPLISGHRRARFSDGLDHLQVGCLNLFVLTLSCEVVECPTDGGMWCLRGLHQGGSEAIRLLHKG
jgi:hypothetical protein